MVVLALAHSKISTRVSKGAGTRKCIPITLAQNLIILAPQSPAQSQVILQASLGSSHESEHNSTPAGSDLSMQASLTEPSSAGGDKPQEILGGEFVPLPEVEDHDLS